MKIIYYYIAIAAVIVLTIALGDFVFDRMNWDAATTNFLVEK
jgi:hypothetical protein